MTMKFRNIQKYFTLFVATTSYYMLFSAVRNQIKVDLHNSQCRKELHEVRIIVIIVQHIWKNWKDNFDTQGQL